MEAINRFFKVQLPLYLKSLPIPHNISGFAELTRDQWLQLLPFLMTLGVLIYLLISPYLSRGKQEKRPRINRKIDLDEDKVATKFDIEDIGEKKVFCRCWKSDKFPFCDGSHNKHNKDTGDNVGPLIIKKFEEESSSKKSK